MTQRTGPDESRTSGPSDTALGYIGDLQFKLLNIREIPREIYNTTRLGQNTEGSVFELQPANVSAITSSDKTPNQPSK